MKLWLLALLLLGVLLSASLAEKEEQESSKEVETKKRFEEAQEESNKEVKTKKRVEEAEEESSKEVETKKRFEEAEEADDNDAVDENEDEEEEAEDDDDGEEYSEEEVDIEKEEQELEENPCMKKTCRRGEICLVDSRRRARCFCIPECITPNEDDLSYQVCSKRNVTYHSECELDRDHCLCRRQLDGCSTPKTGKIRLDYYGPCQQMTPCTERELKIFPTRMTEWLFVVMQQMAQRAKIPDYLDMLDKARNEANHTHAVLWKYCDLDVDPHDRYVSRRELLYTIQSLKAMEHCLIPFLDHCDTDSDGKITLWEWGRCLGLDEDKIKDECKTIRKAAGDIKK